uniref:Ig-like domain-containing protein n=1 Tax=Cyprinodon variegatus TaxID=28743 RepID=A0A3Q2DR74_CYPVA
NYKVASQDSLSEYVAVWEGAPSVLLPCYYKEQLLEIVTVKWSRSDLNPTTVHKHREGDDLREQNQQFRERTSMRPDPLDSLDFSLTLREPQPSDSGIYICSMIDKTEVTLTEVQLDVRGQLPWSICTQTILVKVLSQTSSLLSLKLSCCFLVRMSLCN